MKEENYTSLIIAALICSVFGGLLGFWLGAWHDPPKEYEIKYDICKQELFVHSVKWKEIYRLVFYSKNEEFVVSDTVLLEG